MIDEVSFREVLTSAKTGDGLAFEKLYRSMNRRVLGFVAARGASDPEGLVNDVFLKVFTNISSFAGNEIQFSAWVFKIARNTLIDEGRRQKRQPEVTPLDVAHHGAARGDAEVDAIGLLSDASLRAKLDCLTVEQREIVLLRIVSDLTVEAIAEVLGKRLGAVKAMQRRAFRTLARNFDGEAVPR